MNKYCAEKIYTKVCRKWQTTPNPVTAERWAEALKDISEDEALEAIQQYETKGHSGAPFYTTIYKMAMDNRRQQTSPSPPGDPFPDKDTDNRHFLEWMAFVEGKTPEEMDRYIDEFMTEWEKGKQ